MADLRDNPLTQALVEAEDAANLFPNFKLSATVMPSSTGEDLAATLHVRLTDTSADTEVHARRLLVLALDTSGSMSADAASIEGTTLSRLALAQICVNLSLQSLGPQDDIAIVSFSSRPKLALGITPMTESGKAEAIKVVKALRADGSTDIKGALLMSMELCQKADAGASTEAMVEALKQQMTGGSSVTNPTSSTSSFARAIARRAAAFSNGDPDAATAEEENGDPGVPAGEPTTPAPGSAEATPANAALSALVAAASPSKAHYSVVRIGLFTDGYPEPNISPDAKAELLKLLGDAERQKAVLSTFGFGNDIARDLLVQLAQAGGGNFAHISDSSMALTTFVNFISSFKSTSSAGRVALTFQGVSIPRPLGSGAADEKEKDKEVPSKTSGPLASRISPAADSAATAADDDKYCLVKVKRVYGSQPSSQASSSGPAAAAFHRAASNGFVGDRSVAIDLGTVQKGDDQPRSVVLDLAFNPSLLSTASGVDALVVTANAYGCGGRNNKPSKAMITLSVGQILDAARSAKVVTATAAAAPTSGEVIEDLPAAVVDTSAITTFSQLYDHEAEVARLRGHYIDSIRAIVKEAAGLLARGDGGKGDDLIKPCREKINSLMDELQQPFPQALSAPALTRNAAPGSTAAEDARKEASLAVASDPRVASLRQNIYDDEEPERGQVGMAFKKVGWLEKWGLSYLQSFLLAHSRALCTNFKDISLQSYAGKAFNKEKEGLESSLSSLLVELVSDAIKQSQQELDRMRHCYGRGSVPSGSYSYGSAPAPALSASSVTSLYDARGGCFSGDSTVTRTDEKGGNKETIPLAELKAGMTVLGVGVRNGGEYPVKVRAVLVRRAVPGGPTTTFYDKGDGLKLTPWHPYAFHTLAQYHPLQWAFPDVLPQGARRIEVENADLYNVVLEEEEMGIAVGKGMCATLGHGITPASLEEADDGDKFLLKALSHPYYGDRARVLADIERLEAQQPQHKEKGQLESKGEIRDAETNLVVGIV